MKMMTLLFALFFSSVTFATPETAVSDALTKFMDAVSGGNEQAKIASLCKLAKSKLDTAAIGQDLLGGFFSKLERDANGIAKFKTLVPSIVVDQFHNLVKGKNSFTIKGRVAKGSARVGVQVEIGGKRYTITVLKNNEKIVDVEHSGFSLVKNKSRDFQNDLQALYATNRDSSKPVTDLVDGLVRRGVTKCVR